MFDNPHPGSLLKSLGRQVSVQDERDRKFEALDEEYAAQRRRPAALEMLAVLGSGDHGYPQQ